MYPAEEGTVDMQRIKLFFDALEYILFRLLLVVLLVLCGISLLAQHWPLHWH
jgi:hypothetical protein